MADNKTVYAGLLAVQRDLKAPKNQFNSFGKYKYRSCEDILSAARPLCNDNGLILVLSDFIDVCDNGEKGLISKVDKYNKPLPSTEAMIGQRIYVRAVATVIDVVTGDSYSVSASAREPEEKAGMDSAQITGATSSYARKYALCGLFALDDTRDSDTDEYQKQNAVQAEFDKKLINNTSQQGNDNLKKNVIQQLGNKAKSRNIGNEVIKKMINHLGFKSSADMTVNQLCDLINDFDKILKEIQK